ncbi:MAG TPA: TfuA-related McrA-glycine thioamidation protein [Methanomassiliicoccales archaeon]|nr:TfuA-related McrA-glycine thioamidation protein [Methanomassiliicoccales archaeon]
MSRPVVFLGPSLSLDEAREILDADYRPPVKRGDLTQLGDVDVVGIIDGVFLQNCSVGHREIMALMVKGVKVVGGGSMGALRASELSQLGMIGVGRIFEEYSSGKIEGDDEVALVFDPENYEALSEPMVNIRFLVKSAIRDGVIDLKEGEEMLTEFRKIYYPRRTISGFLSMISSLLSREKSERFNFYFTANYRDYKKEDAITVLLSL